MDKNEQVEFLQKALIGRHELFGIEITKDARLVYPPGLPDEYQKYADPVNLQFPVDTKENTLHSYQRFAETAYENYHSVQKIRERFHDALQSFGVDVEVTKFIKSALSNKIELIKADEEWRTVTGVVYSSSMKFDKQGHRAPNPIVVRDAAFEFLKNLNVYTGPGIMHKDFEKDVVIVGSWFSPYEMTINKKLVAANTWLIMFKVNSDTVWSDIKEGNLTGFSLGGEGTLEVVNEEEEHNTTQG